MLDALIPIFGGIPQEVKFLLGVEKRPMKKASTSCNSDSLLETDMLQIYDVSVILMVLTKLYGCVVRLSDHLVSMISSSGNLSLI